MVIKIRTDYTETPWITPGKVYEARKTKTHEHLYSFMGELGSPCFTGLKRSLHIGGQDWEIVNEE